MKLTCCRQALRYSCELPRAAAAKHDLGACMARRSRRHARLQAAQTFDSAAAEDDEAAAAAAAAAVVASEPSNR